MERTIFELEELYTDTYYDLGNTFKTIAIENAFGRTEISNMATFVELINEDESFRNAINNSYAWNNDIFFQLIIVDGATMQEREIYEFRSQEELDEAYDAIEAERKELQGEM